MYKDKYDELIDKAVERNWTKETAPCYTEKHHITPRCLGGSDEKNNLVELTAQEHYDAHRLLAMAYPNEGKLQQAWWLMCHAKPTSINSNRIIEVTAEEYAEAKERAARISSEHTRGRKLTREQIDNISGENNHQYGKPHTEEYKRRQSEIQKGRKQKIVTCPHCGKEGGVQSMKRWHFDKCKLVSEANELAREKARNAMTELNNKRRPDGEVHP